MCCMVDISTETPDQVEQRLGQVIAAAELVVLPGLWAFREAHLAESPQLSEQLLAVVRDEDSWSWLASATGDEPEAFALFSFHFQPGLDNSGFVGWLASLLKERLGTGVFVGCGQNSARGGIYDYWGCPASLASQTAQIIRELRTQTQP